MDVLVRRPPLLPFGSILPSEYQMALANNGNSPYSRTKVLFLLPAQEDPYIADLVDSMKRNIPPHVEYVFAIIAQNHQIGISIATHDPLIVITPGDDWLELFLPRVAGLPRQTSKELHGRWIPVTWSPSGKCIIVYPLEDLPLKRRRRLSGEKSPPSSPSVTESPPRRIHGALRGAAASPSSSPRGSPPIHSSRSQSPSPLGDETTDMWSSVTSDLQRLIESLSSVRPPGHPCMATGITAGGL